VADLGLGGGQDLLGIAGVVTGQEREPRFFVAGFLFAPEGADGAPVVSGRLAQFLQPLRSPGCLPGGSAASISAV
jgi:hypothetical protein